MKNIGIVCEYNPFHRGHAKQMSFVNRQGTSICLMSGNYVQRGEPAILDKYVRAKAAVMASVSCSRGVFSRGTLGRVGDVEVG